MSNIDLIPLTARPVFQVNAVNNGGYVINDRGRTVALISKHGYVDWLLRTPHEAGELITHIPKETHLSYVRGLKFNLEVPYLRDQQTRIGTRIESISFTLGECNEELWISAQGRREDGRFRSLTKAHLSLSSDGLRYEWRLSTTISHLGDTPHTLSEIEYNNILPGQAYRGILHLGEKEFSRTLCEDAEGVVWEFPHQHAYHYGRKLRPLTFGKRSWAGFFDSQAGCPVVTVMESDLPLHWGICDMYYDLHCAAAPPHTFSPGEEVRFDYKISYLLPDEAAALSRHTQRVAFTEAEICENASPRVELGLNRFDECIQIREADDACFFRQAAPARVWEKASGPDQRSALRLTGTGERLSWGTEPPFHAINGTTLLVSARVQLDGVTGHGFFLRLSYYHYVWDSPAGFQPLTTLESPPLTGSTNGWEIVILPPLEIPAGPVEDGMLKLDLIIEGCGVVRITDIDLKLTGARCAVAPSLPEAEVAPAL